MLRRVAHLVVACVVLGGGVGLLLLAALGSDGYSTFVNGLSLSTGLSFLAMNCCLGVLLVAMAWWRGLRPGAGTVIQPVVVGAAVSAVLALGDTPHSLALRFAMLVAAFPIVAIGVAGYLGSGTGAGPTEAAALAWDPPIPFRWSYTVVQCSGAIGGWLMGAAIGVGTLLVILALGPAVDLISRHVPLMSIAASAREGAEESRDEPVG